jgi:hypothetical protein
MEGRAMVRSRPVPPALVALTAFVLFSGCAADHGAPNAPPAPTRAAGRHAEIAAAIAVQDRASDGLLAMRGVVATATGLDGSGRAVIRVYTTGAPVRIPETIEGVPVEVEISGELKPFALTDRLRPVPIGASVGNANECLPGTIGAVLVRGAQRYLLSANHVFARQNLATIGESIVQPSRPDASATCDPSPARNVVATLAEFEPLRFDGTDNVMDAAIALLSDQTTCATPADGYGAPGAPIAPADGLAIEKMGRGTGLTHGAITGINAKVNVTYAGGKAHFTGQIMTSKAFGGFGDSGALVVTDDAQHRTVGLVFAGGSNGSAVVSPIGPILARFGATLCAP